MNRDSAAGGCVRSFGELELAIMDLAWDASRPMHPGEVQGKLRPEHAVAYTTVLTVMTRLHDKGWLTREKEGRGYSYWPTVSRAEYAAGLMSQALAIGGDDATTLALFAGQLSPGDRQQLQAQPGSQVPAARRGAVPYAAGRHGRGHRTAATHATRRT